MPSIITCFSPALLHLEEVNKRTVVIIDVLRATSTIATALFNGAKAIIPVDNVADCIRIGKQIDGITAGERDGKIAEGLEHGNSPFEYSPGFINEKVLVLTTTNGTKLLHMALDKAAKDIVTGSFPNLTAVCDYLQQKNENVILACAGWKDRVNIEDSLFAGAVLNRLKNSFDPEGDSSKIAHNLYVNAQKNLYGFMKKNNASHYHRLTNFGLEKDIRYCLTEDVANVLPVYKEGKLVTE